MPDAHQLLRVVGDIGEYIAGSLRIRDAQEQRLEFHRIGEMLRRAADYIDPPKDEAKPRE